MSSASYLTVKALTKYIKRKFDADPHLREVYVKGELSNVKIHQSGHIYFTLKDDGARIAATMFKTAATKLAFEPKEGMQVFIRGDVNVYEGYGTYQLYVQEMQPDGVGSLFVAFNQLKEQLQKEGLFKTEWKQPIPRFPERIGVLTSTTGAAIRDICTTLKRRYPLAEILIYPTLVQGGQAAPNIVQNIEQANFDASCDVLIVGRGGGSIEDLWAFNEEIVARAIFSSRIPIISAVGHETDTTIADFVADLRAPTPTAAAEIAVPDQQDLFQRVLTQKSQLHQMVRAQLMAERQRLNKLQQSYPLSMPERLYRPFTEKLAQLESDLQKAMQVDLMKKSALLQQLHSAIEQHSPKKALTFYQRELETRIQQLTRASSQFVTKQKHQFEATVRTLEALNPLAILTRGFTVAYKDEQMIKSSAEVKQQDQLTLTFHDGEVIAEVTKILPKNEGE
ncbi:exodeoxyribonuclease VII large subunit [Lysinibacillus pakistanensis]|uniref:Exodeoxyribonuclease 7 large subunit n=1 Tax=Lysinibacillus pakistanensis TaxID=759811 RepID=A0AAX3WPU8_9BACI|nr:exodeoxyribonuclease VII large subunit [Lysinibacillus pakistanensis]MDM5234270.1 exodeoxyribonuclease VII large subunit [Lysinibacillus pakistanensis]WHY44861.1 exodeoxyribonuclease VII large subunit [Lysinibacillus pakistanensis]WHY49868.1 exodeoxyribonuclease VII large subunit [Lysinibacillus pakistanensis]